MEEKRPDCEKEFQRIWDRLGKGDTTLDSLRDSDHQHELAIKELQINLLSLVKSMCSLTRAIWGAAGTALVLLISFFIWYIQTL